MKRICAQQSPLRRSDPPDEKFSSTIEVKNISSFYNKQHTNGIQQPSDKKNMFSSKGHEKIFSEFQDVHNFFG